MAWVLVHSPESCENANRRATHDGRRNKLAREDNVMSFVITSPMGLPFAILKRRAVAYVLLSFSCALSQAVTAGAAARQSSQAASAQSAAQGEANRAAPSQPSSKALIREHLRKATEYLKANDADCAQQEFEAVLALDPKNADAHAGLGAIAFVGRDYRLASRELSKALAADPSLTRSQALLGISQRRLSDPAARASLEKSFAKLTEKNLRIQVGLELAYLYERQGELDATASVLRTLVAIDPDNANILFAAQRIYTELADNTLSKLAILAPHSALMEQTIAEHLINNGDLEGAIAHYRKALEIDPRVRGVNFELGEAILQAAPLDPATQEAAEKEFSAAMQKEGDSAKLEDQLGKIAFVQPDMDKAHEHFQRAFVLNPQDSEAQLGLGKVLVAMSKPTEALRYLRMATQSDPLNGEAHYRLAIACKRLDLQDEAEKELRLFQEIKQTKDQVRELYRQMNKKPAGLDDQAPESDSDPKP
jgi:tetratricopeptide (TPR) repeat protein